MKKNILSMIALLLSVLFVLTCCSGEPAKTDDTTAADETTAPAAEDTTAQPEDEPKDPSEYVLFRYDTGDVAASSLIRNAALWNGPKALDLDEDFIFLVEYQSDKIHEYELGSNYKDTDGDFMHTGYTAGEWMNAMLNLHGSTFDTGDPIPNTFWEGGAPETREEALERTYAFLKYLRDQEPIAERRTAMDCVQPGYHYAGKVGFKFLGTELMVHSSSYDIAMCRGAAKQYDTGWFVDITPWIGDVADPDYWFNENKNNYFERAMLTSYFSGADMTIAEAGENLAFDSEDPTKLSPYGEMLKKVNAFTSENTPERGTAYTPFAIIIDEGFGGVGHKNVKSWEEFDLTDAMKSAFDIFAQFWDTGNFSGYGESGMVLTHIDNLLTNSMYGMTSVDVFMQGVSYDLLATYPAVFVTSEEISEEEAAVYEQYVRNGGTLICNTAYREDLDARFGIENDEKGAYVEIPVDKGSVIYFGKAPWLSNGLRDVVSILSERCLPFEFSCTMGYTISVSDDGKTINLLLCNNGGVSYEEINQSYARDVEITYRGVENIVSAEDIYNDHEVGLDGKTMSIHLDAGDTAVVKIILD